MSEEDLGDIRRRRRAVEQDAVAAEIRGFRNATTAISNALRADSLDLREDFNSLRDHVDRDFMEMRGKPDATAAGRQRIVVLINSLIDGRDR